MEWIPVSERLPEVTFVFADAESVVETEKEIKFVNPFKCYESKPVLVQGKTTSFGTETSGIFTAIYAVWEYYGQEPTTEWRDNMSQEVEIIVDAWMPLPRPYKADRKTENSSEKPNNSTISKMEQVDEPQTEPLPKTINGVRIADAVAWADKWLEDNSVSEMWDMIRTLRDATEWQDEPQTDCAWK